MLSTMNGNQRPLFATGPTECTLNTALLSLLEELKSLLFNLNQCWNLTQESRPIKQVIPTGTEV